MLGFQLQLVVASGRLRAPPSLGWCHWGPLRRGTFPPSQEHWGDRVTAPPPLLSEDVAQQGTELCHTWQQWVDEAVLGDTQALLPSTPGRQWSPGASPSPSSDCLEGAEQASVSCIFTCVQPHWCHFGKQGTELLLTFVGKRVRTRQKEVMESVACFVPVGISRTKDGAEISLLQSNRGTEWREARQNWWKLPSSPTSGGTVWRIPIPTWQNEVVHWVHLLGWFQQGPVGT